MGCICTEPPKEKCNVDIFKESGEVGKKSENDNTSCSVGPPPITNASQTEARDSLPQNEQKPNKHSDQEKYSNQEVSFKNSPTALRNDEVKKSTTKHFETNSQDLKTESDVSAKTKTFSLLPETTSEMKQGMADFNLVLERAVTSEECTPGEEKSTKLQWDRRVLSNVSVPDLKPLDSDKISLAELAKAREDLEQLELRNKQKDEEIQNLRAENYRLKDHAKLKASQISLKSLTLKEKHSSMRRRREEITKSSGMTQKMVHRNMTSFREEQDSKNTTSFREEQEHELEPGLSITEVSEGHEISPKKEPSLHFRNTPREERDPMEIVDTETKWTFFEPTVLK